MQDAILKDFDTRRTAELEADINFVDIDLTLTTVPLTKDFAIRRGNRAVQQSIRTIVMATPGDLPFEDDYGVGVNSILGENFDPVAVLELKERIAQQIARYETRAELVNVDVQHQQHDIRVGVAYVVKNNPQEQAVTVVVERVL